MDSWLDVGDAAAFSNFRSLSSVTFAKAATSSTESFRDFRASRKILMFMLELTGDYFADVKRICKSGAIWRRDIVRSHILS